MVNHSSGVPNFFFLRGDVLNMYEVLKNYKNLVEMTFLQPQYLGPPLIAVALAL